MDELYLKDFIDHYGPTLLFQFQRIQLNGLKVETVEDAKRYSKSWAKLIEAGLVVSFARPIIQVKEFRSEPEFGMFDQLFDLSGGEGKLPDLKNLPPLPTPVHPMQKFGYAGGLGLETATDYITAINSDQPYYLDCESSIRTNDWFDASIVNALCEKVFPNRVTATMFV